jgi:hypothetical protein
MFLPGTQYDATALRGDHGKRRAPDLPPVAWLISPEVPAGTATTGACSNCHILPTCARIAEMWRVASVMDSQKGIVLLLWGCTNKHSTQKASVLRNLAKHIGFGTLDTI